MRKQVSSESGLKITTPAQTLLWYLTGPPRPLNTPITSSEVQYAASKLKNGKAVGPDEIPNELLKYAPPVFFQQYACLINRSFEGHEHVPSFTEGFLTPLQKPGKPKGPLKSLRPLCLLNGTRKLLSLITLHRIQRQIAKVHRTMAKCLQGWS